jgi:hypothetical protein
VERSPWSPHRRKRGAWWTGWQVEQSLGWRGRIPKVWYPRRKKQQAPKESWAPGGKKKTKKRARVGACRCASVQQSLPRRNFTARHGRQSLRAIPGCMSSWATNTRQRRYVPTSDFILQCEIGQRRTGTDSPFLTTHTRQPNPHRSASPVTPILVPVRQAQTDRHETKRQSQP